MGKSVRRKEVKTHSPNGALPTGDKGRWQACRGEQDVVPALEDLTVLRAI